MSRLGRVPQVGDAVSLASGAALAVLSVDRHVPAAVRISDGTAAAFSASTASDSSSPGSPHVDGEAR